MSDILDLVTETNVDVVDRSTLEAWATCPLQGYLRERGKGMLATSAAEVGNEIHEAIARLVTDFAAGEVDNFDDARERLTQYVQESRPDVQGDAIAGLARYQYDVCRRLMYLDSGETRHPNTILKHDGGSGDRSGQIAHDVEVGGSLYRLTCEVDLLLSTAAATELELDDWKTGWKEWTASDVAASFQFRFYAMLLMLNYPKVDRVWVRIHNTRHGTSTGSVCFHARRIDDWLALTMNALEIRAKYNAKRRKTLVPAWPNVAKCAMCDTISGCHACFGDPVTLADDPEAFLRQLALYETRIKTMKDVAKKHVQAHGNIEAGAYKFGHYPSDRKTYTLRVED